MDTNKKAFNPLDYGAIPVATPSTPAPTSQATPGLSTPAPTKNTFNPLDYGATPVEKPVETPAPDSGIKGGFLGDLLTGNTQKFGKTIGESIAAPENAQLYSDALESHTKIQSALLKAIKDKKALGQDTSRLEAALQHHTESTPQLKDFTGDVIDKTPGQVIGEGIGTGLEALSGGILEGGAKTVASKELSTLGKINQAGKIGAGYGAIASGANSMAEGGNPTDVVEKAAIGGLAGYGLGAGLGAAGAGVSKVSKLINPATESIIAKREAEIANIENNYAKTRKVNEFSNDAGVASRKRVASTDVLVNAVDKEGLIRTKQPGGAVDQYKAMTLDNAEGVVRDALEKEGATVDLNYVEKELERQVYKSGLQGKNLRSALNDVKKEISGYRLSADSEGKVPLTLIHDAKVDSYNSINFLTAPEVKANRKAVARGLKNVVERKSNFNVGEVNKELGKYLQDMKLLENLDGKRVKGGRLGKYFSQISGNIVGGIAGSAVGGPVGSAVGTVVGGELGARIRGNILSKMLGGEAGQAIEKSPILEKAIANNKLPRLGLPAPRDEFKNVQGSGPTIKLPKRSQSTISGIEDVQSKSFGNRNINQSITPSPNKNETIPKILPKNNQSGKIGLGAIVTGAAAVGAGAVSRLKNEVKYEAKTKPTLKVPESVKKPEQKLVPDTKLGAALAQLESSGGKDKSSADKGEMKWFTGLTNVAIKELKRLGIKKFVDVNNKKDVLDASVKYFNLMQERHPEKTPGEVYVDHYWTQSKTPEQRQKKIDQFNELIS